MTSPKTKKQIRKQKNEAEKKKQDLLKTAKSTDFWESANLHAVFGTFKKNGLNLRLAHFTAPIPSSYEDPIYDLLRRNMRTVYLQTGWSWNQKEKRRELFEEGESKFILCFDAAAAADDQQQQPLVAFLSYRFDFEDFDMELGRQPVIYVYEVQVEPRLRRKGVGKFLMQLAELLGRKAGMAGCSLTAQSADTDAFYDRLGYETVWSNVEDVAADGSPPATLNDLKQSHPDWFLDETKDVKISESDRHHSHSHGEHAGHSHGHSHEPTTHSHSHDHAPEPLPLSTSWLVVPSALAGLPVWAHAILATSLISLAPLCLLYVIPLSQATDESGTLSPLLRVLLAFAAGGLLGDVFLHLLPHADTGAAAAGHSHAHGDAAHAHSLEGLMTGIWVLVGITLFLAIEKTVISCQGTEHGGHSHSHSHTHSSHQQPKKTTSSAGEGKKKSQSSSSSARSKSPARSTKKKNTSDTKKTTKKSGQQKPVELVLPSSSASGWLNLAADFSHNFTDGLAIGATFLKSERLGVITTLAVLFHEVPHEIGDFAILLKCGFTKRQAILAQVSTALGALLGTVVALLAPAAASTDASHLSFILPVTAGGFIYIACVSVLPSLLVPTSLLQSLTELSALVIGVAFMALIAVLE